MVITYFCFAMLGLITDIIQDYATKHTSKQNNLLVELEQFTTAHHSHAHMLSGAYQGKLLSMLSKLIKPKYILEIGTFTGFSALCLAEGLVPDGKLITLEKRTNDVEHAQEWIAKSDYKNQIEVLSGEALHLIPTLNYDWDLVFIDADKTNYINYYEAIISNLKKGGVILADNTLFHGEVLKDELKGINAKSIDAFNKYVNNDERVNNILLTIRDGLTLIIKK